jgi:2-iminoacetate synthase
LRVTLSQDEVRRETCALKKDGFRNILLVAGEHPRFVSNNYLADSIRTVLREVASVSLEVGPMETSDYEPLVLAGAEGLVVYQETYDRSVYADMHTAGPKRDFDSRLATAERAYAAGFRRLGIGALFGLSDWRSEAIAVAAHAAYLLRHCWKAQVTVSLPRLRPCAGEFEPLTELGDRDLVQLICAFRLFLPDVGLVLSTREPARLRDGLLPLGITMMSAGSHTEPGGYTGAGSERVHLTQRGRIVELAGGSSEWAGRRRAATGQFETADDRSPREVAALISQLGYEPVWKDWDAALLSA